MRYKCDSENDCFDNSDEDGCPVSTTNATCIPNEFKCGMKCIPNAWKCDGDIDCNNSEDEIDCPIGVCDSSQFRVSFF